MENVHHEAEPDPRPVEVEEDDDSYSSAPEDEDSAGEDDLLGLPAPVKPKRQRKPKPKAAAKPAAEDKPVTKTKTKTRAKTKAKIKRQLTRAVRKVNAAAAKAKPAAGKPRRTKSGAVDKRTLPKAKRGKPTSGQSGPKITLGWKDLKKPEQKLVTLLAESKEPLKIKDLSKRFKKDPEREYDTAQLAVRNWLRRPARAGWIQRRDRGTYSITSAGRTKYQNAG